MAKGSDKAVKGPNFAARLALWAKYNEQRVPCAVCGNIVLPTEMDRHHRVYHAAASSSPA